MFHYLVFHRPVGIIGSRLSNLVYRIHTLSYFPESGICAVQVGGVLIGGTMYCVRVHFNEDAKETMKDKIKRMLENDVKASQHTA